MILVMIEMVIAVIFITMMAISINNYDDDGDSDNSSNNGKDNNNDKNKINRSNCR